MINFLRWKIEHIIDVLYKRSDVGGHRFLRQSGDQMVGLVGRRCYKCGHLTIQDPKKCPGGKNV